MSQYSVTRVRADQGLDIRSAIKSAANGDNAHGTNSMGNRMERLWQPACMTMISDAKVAASITSKAIVRSGLSGAFYPAYAYVMIINQLPDSRSFKNHSGGNQENTIIYASTNGKYHYPDHVTPYLLVANFRNTGHYQLNGRAAFINERFFYFLNAGDHLEIDFQQKEPLETMLVLFSEPLIKEVAGYHRATADKLQDNCCEPLTIGDMAKVACMNKFHFLKLFKQRYGVTPHQYLVRLKLEHARTLLSSGKYSVSEACQRIGFESPATFTHLFKRTYGCLPSKFPILNK